MRDSTLAMGLRQAGIAETDVLVLAGGLGTRLRPAIGESPKLLAPIGGRPYLAYLIDWLRRFGARRLVLSLGYKAEAVLDYLASRSFPEIDIVPVVEPEPLGTAGAIRYLRDQLSSDPVLVMNGDSYVDADLGAFLQRHRQSQTLGSMLCTEIEDAGRYGRVTVDAAGRITGFIEKDAAFHGRATINAGCYMLSATLLDRIAAGSPRSLERDVFEQLPAGTLAALCGQYRFIDIGTPESLALASAFFAAAPPSERTPA